MSLNHYFDMNYSDAPSLPVDPLATDMTQSDSIYDSHRCVSHAFVPLVMPDGTEISRVISDVEIAVSSSASVRAVVSPEYQRQLREGLLNQPRQGPRTVRVSDDDLASHVIPQGLEHDEAASLAKMALDTVRPSDPPVSSESPVSSEPSVSSEP